MRVAQQFGNGEIFHARTKAWKDSNLDKIEGLDIVGIGNNMREHLRSNLSKDELITQFAIYESKAIHLK